MLARPEGIAVFPHAVPVLGPPSRSASAEHIRERRAAVLTRGSASSGSPSVAWAAFGAPSVGAGRLQSPPRSRVRSTLPAPSVPSSAVAATSVATATASAPVVATSSSADAVSEPSPRKRRRLRTIADDEDEDESEDVDEGGAEETDVEESESEPARELEHEHMDDSVDEPSSPPVPLPSAATAYVTTLTSLEEIGDMLRGALVAQREAVAMLASAVRDSVHGGLGKASLFGATQVGKTALAFRAANLLGGCREAVYAQGAPRRSGRLVYIDVSQEQFGLRGGRKQSKSSSNASADDSGGGDAASIFMSCVSNAMAAATPGLPAIVILDELDNVRGTAFVTNTLHRVTDATFLSNIQKCHGLLLITIGNFGSKSMNAADLQLQPSASSPRARGQESLVAMVKSEMLTSPYAYKPETLSRLGPDTFVVFDYLSSSDACRLVRDHVFPFVFGAQRWCHCSVCRSACAAEQRSVFNVVADDEAVRRVVKLKFSDPKIGLQSCSLYVRKLYDESFRVLAGSLFARPLHLRWRARSSTWVLQQASSAGTCFCFGVGDSGGGSDGGGGDGARRALHGGADGSTDRGDESCMYTSLACSLVKRCRSCALRSACLFGHVVVLERVLSEAVDAGEDTVDKHGWTLLHYAALSAQWACIQYLLGTGVFFWHDLDNVFGVSPAMVLVLRARSTANTPTGAGSDAVMKAAVRECLRAGSGSTVDGVSGRRCLMMATGLARRVYVF